MQTTDKSHFKGPLDCLLQTVRKEGIKGVYKGATPPLVGWMFMDSIMLGSLSVYRRVLNDNIFNPHTHLLSGEQKPLPVIGHAMAGTMAGWTVSFIAGPVEHIKARLQVQYAAEKSQRLYSGPIDCLKKIVCKAFLYHDRVAPLMSHSSAATAFEAYTMVSQQRSSSAHSSASGGAPTTSSRVLSKTTPI